MTYAIVRVGGKQYRVEKGDELVVDRLREDEGAKLSLEPLLFRPDKGDTVMGGDDLGKVKVEATVKGHERGQKIHVLKFKPKKGYKRRSGHRSDLTRLEIGEIKLLSRRPAGQAKEGAAAPKAEAAAEPKAEPKKAPTRKPAAKKPAATKKTPARKPAPKKSSSAGSRKAGGGQKKETGDGS
jgi:large subunit ribosomal protein L21